ncbi:MAG: hypothetical protein HGA39_09245 [Coriobacteriia bacterium]|nr:hypothetical protein [Coriobacteriia bacterium]
MPSTRENRVAGQKAAVGFEDTALYRAIADFASGTGASLGDPTLLQDFSDALGVRIEAAVSNPILQYGVHTEAMFEWVVHALGGTVLSQRLDNGSGTVLEDEEVSSPDFLLVTQEGKRFVVEVKNCASKTNPPLKVFRRVYLERLATYADKLGAEAKVAIFWSHAGFWSMVDVGFLLSTTDSAKVSLSMFDALAESEMASIGDRWVHLRPYPFRFRMSFDILDREPGNGNQTTLSLRVSDVGMTLGSKTLEDKTDSKVVSYLAMFGMETDGGDDFVFDSDSAGHIEFVAGDDPETEESQMLTIGPLSSVLARHYRLTSCDENGQVSGLAYNRIPVDHPIRLLAGGYQGSQVGFIYFKLSPRHESDVVELHS